MTTYTSTDKNYFLSVPVILLFCFGLFWLDHETQSIADLFKPGNLVALMLYFFPTWLICSLLYTLFQKWNSKNSFAWSLVLGIPAGFALMVLVLSWWMGRLG
jgi:hypothetical protein